MNYDTKITECLDDHEIEYDKAGYDPAKTFRENSIDSLEVMTLLLGIEEKYGVKFSEAEANEMRTPNDIAVCLNYKL